MAGESKKKRKESCAYQNKIARENGFKRFYAEELSVLEGKTSLYKGIKIVRTPTETQSFSFGIIFLGKDLKADAFGVYTLRHEYGHTIQLEKLGVVDYTRWVVIPSLTGAAISNSGSLNVDYYSLPWEFEADVYGHVRGRGGYEPEVLEWYNMYKAIVKAFT